ncbi:MAG TPA: N-acetylmuramoyl-L-alanine amidase [Caulobacteraceae bacterium]|nr:N-acetylmuramoyl-L-alanine amidase [Caulobacteraceae bacterium]
MKATPAPSPNFNARVRPPDMVLLHYTGMPSFDAALARLTDPKAEVSAHYLIDEKGKVFALVAEERRAWHAGVSSWRGETDINGASIGIELDHPGHEFGYRPFAEAQIAVALELLDDIRSRWTIPQERILAHADVAPARRADPGELFPWKRLAEAGHGLWVEPEPAPGPVLKSDDDGPPVLLLQGALRRWGFGLPPTGLFDAATAAAVRAFQRHWVQGAIDGAADGVVRARLMALLRLAP